MVKSTFTLREIMYPPLLRVKPAFTLIEVLVALVVIAIGLLAILSVAARSIQVGGDLQNRVFGSWVAQNEIIRLRLAPKWPAVGKSNGEVLFANRKWNWRAKIEGTPDPGLRRVTVSISLAATPKQTVTRLIGFIGRPNAQPVKLPTPATTGRAQPGPG